MAMQREERQDTISEIEQRAAILALFDQAGFKAQGLGLPLPVPLPDDLGLPLPIPLPEAPTIPGVPEIPAIPIPETPIPTCANLPGMVGGLIPVLDQGSSNLGLFAPLLTVIQTILGVVKKVLSTVGLGTISDALLQTINAVLTTVITPLSDRK